MGSMAFWYEKRESNSNRKPGAIMNFNLWTQCNAGEASFLDIGFVISDIKLANNLYFFIPFSNAKIEDLSKNINTSKSISAIFNEKYSVIDSSETCKFWPVTNTGDKVEFVIYSWNGGIDSAVTVIPEEGSGSIVKIDAVKIVEQINNIQAKKFQDTDKLYFRFRVEIPEPSQKDTIVRKYSSPNSFLQSTWATTYIVDFRFDDLRSLPEEISSKIITQKTEFVPVTKLHFLLMTKAHVDVETGARDLSLRELEENTWDNYIDKRFETKDVVAYHCAVKAEKEEKPICQWEFFAKVKVNNSTAKVVFLYLFVLAGLTILFNCLSNYVWLLIEEGHWLHIAFWGIVYCLIFYFLIQKFGGLSKRKWSGSVDKRK